MSDIGISSDLIAWAILIICLAVLLMAVGILSFVLLRNRAEKYERGLFGSWPIRDILPDQLDPLFCSNELGPSLNSEIVFLGRGALRVPGGASDAETWILAVLAKQAHCAFEFGTCTGKTAYLWARNSPNNAKVVTLTLSPDDLATYRHATGDAAEAYEAARQESTFANFVYSGTAVESKITQLYGDSKAFDETPYLGKCDLIFIDGSHAYSYIESDTQKALKMIAPGGLILWHDYRGSRRAPDVFRYLNILSTRLPLVHIIGTSLIAYRAPSL